MLRRGLLVIAIALLALVGGALAYYGPRLRQQGRIGAGFVAKEVCSCIFVGGRELAACRADLRPRAERVRAQVLLPERAVRAWIPLLGEQTARYREGTGCTLD